MSQTNIFLEALAMLTDTKADSQEREHARGLLMELCLFAENRSAEDTALFIAEVDSRFRAARREYFESIMIEAAKEARAQHDASKATYTPGGKQ